MAGNVEKLASHCGKKYSISVQALYVGKTAGVR
jgi:hypothetical protein